MAINVNTPFRRTGPNPIDDSITLTKAEMLAVSDDMMPDVYFAVCKDDGNLYTYSKTATPSTETGKFKLVEGGGGGGSVPAKTYTMDWDEANKELELNDGTITQSLPLTGLQSELTAGTNITIDPTTNTISATGGASIQVDTLPTADASLEGKIYQYVGATTAELTNGYFYECVEITPSTNPKTYEWKQKDVQEGGSGDTHHVELTQAEYNALTPEEKNNGTVYFITDAPTDNYHHYTDTERQIGTFNAQPLYEKTLFVLSPQLGADKTISLGLSSDWTILNYYGFVFTATDRTRFAIPSGRANIFPGSNGSWGLKHEDFIVGEYHYVRLVVQYIKVLY